MEILVADSSAVYRKMFLTAMTEADKHKTLDFAADCEAALEKIMHRDYDIVVLDAEIPGIGLLHLLKTIRSEIPKALLVLAARPAASNSGLVEAAIASGCVTFCMTKPINDDYDHNIDAIRNTMEDVYALHWAKRAKKPTKPESAGDYTPRTTISEHRFAPEIVLIASSTGGPSALEAVLAGLSRNFPTPIKIVQHIPSYFMEPLASQLANKSTLNVKIAEEGETVAAGTVYIAPGGKHTGLDRRKRIFFNDSPPINGVRPSADALFGSVAEFFPKSAKVLAVILTGMGCDGESGLSKLKENLTCFAIAQSEKTCVVYGMPRAAIEGRLADAVLDLDKIAPAMVKMASPITETT